MPSINTLIEALAAQHPRVIDLSLERMINALKLVGDPHLNCPPIIHIAGTNGKGSTGAFCRSILEASGKRVHVYTSPHLVRYNERFRLAGALVDDEKLIATMKEAIEKCAAVPLTIFELITITGFMLFSRTSADALILEVGLGGRLDATNVITPRVSVITPVSMDHTQFLGDTIAAIAQEKAGIIKPKIPVIVSSQDEDAQEIINRIAARNKAPIQRMGEEFAVSVEEGRMVFQNDEALFDIAPPRLHGAHQVENAGVAIAAVHAFLNGDLSNDAVEQGIRNAKWPARMQRLTNGKIADEFLKGTELWLDGGHNPAAGEALAAVLADMDDKHPMPIVLIVGMLNSKEPHGFFEAFEGLASQVLTIAIPDEPNALDAKTLAEAAQVMGLKAAAMPSFEQAIHAAAQIHNARVVICGSLYLAGYVLEMGGSIIG